MRILEKHGMGEVVGELEGKPLLREFAEWLHKHHHYSPSEIRKILCEGWHGWYPSDLLREPYTGDYRGLRWLGDFLFCMGDFACAKVFGEGYRIPRKYYIEIIPVPSIEYYSLLYIVEDRTRTVLVAANCGQSWSYTPNLLEEILAELVKQVKASSKLLEERFKEA